ncbi:MULTISPECIES: hypothetical protein [Streptomyces]|uniref:Uncharacterized protein n=1 Tax=Streptomyces pini TaxID=1520580 RepID=A0A1I4LF28_9ACTN|nr:MULTISPECIES: hypothetical protein [Streptomyces]SFL89423.1 hypothetical protein SAMN05192584_13119 [Streptomyces pini]
MAAQTPAERALACSFTSRGTRFDVSDLRIDHHLDRSTVLTYRLAIARQGHQEERWEVTLPWDDKSFADVLTSPAPEPDRLSMLVSLVRGLLEEWWETKGHERQSAKMGRRLP